MGVSGTTRGEVEEREGGTARRTNRAHTKGSGTWLIFYMAEECLCMDISGEGGRGGGGNSICFSWLTTSL